ncbi:MAG: hypothetical protein M0T79_15520 [Actinomycetota bacterium]|nr:hypothetical protein [Actinomycetota bacterium]
MRYLGKGLLAVVVAVSVGCLSVVAALASPPRGNAAAIAFERSTIRAYTHVPGEKIVGRGGEWLKETPSGGFSIRYGEAWAPKGYFYVSDTSVAAMRDGRVLWESETLSPSCPPSSTGSTGTGVCVSTGPSAELVYTKSGQYWRWNLPGSALRCFYSGLTGSDPVGHTTWTIGGEDFTSIVHSGRMVIVTGTWRWNKYQTGTETDTIFAHSRLVSLETMSVSKGPGAHEPAFTETDTYTNLNYTPSEPKVTVCG